MDKRNLQRLLFIISFCFSMCASAVVSTTFEATKNCLDHHASGRWCIANNARGILFDFKAMIDHSGNSADTSYNITHPIPETKTLFDIAGISSIRTDKVVTIAELSPFPTGLSPSAAQLNCGSGTTNCSSSQTRARIVMATGQWSVLAGIYNTPNVEPVPDPTAAAIFGAGLIALALALVRFIQY